MALFDFLDDSTLIGTVREVDTRKVSIHVRTNEDLRKAKVGQLVTLKVASAVETWLIGIIEKVIKSVVLQGSVIGDSSEESDGLDAAIEDVINTVRLTLVGTARWNAYQKKNIFSRSLVQVPEVEAKCYVLREKQLEAFMNILAESGDRRHSLDLGKYAIDEAATAYLDGNKFFQRHAAILGSTGSGKSWTVASILEKSSKLPSSNLVVFDLHGEYRELSYASHLRIPGPDELGVANDHLLFLPYWLLNAEEMQATFIDGSGFSAHNQVMAFQNAVIEEKRKTLKAEKKDDVLAAFTMDSPIPFFIEEVVTQLKFLNDQMVPGSRGAEKKGPFNGEFDRLIPRLESKLSDKRYGFLFQTPAHHNDYSAMASLVRRVMDFSKESDQIKIIDFSEVPSDVLPVIVGLVARLIYQVQFWTASDKRHPIALVCDEAHLYLPKKDGKNPAELRAVEAFERIAKEGRKYGVALLIVSQRPADVSSTILSQCNNIIALRLTNGDDQATVRKLLPESLESLLEIVSVMDIGEALVVGDATLLPTRVKLAEPVEKPLSATIDFWTQWQEQKSSPDFVQVVENMRKQSRR